MDLNKIIIGSFLAIAVVASTIYRKHYSTELTISPVDTGREVGVFEGKKLTVPWGYKIYFRATSGDRDGLVSEDLYVDQKKRELAFGNEGSLTGRKRIEHRLMPLQTLDLKEGTHKLKYITIDKKLSP